MTFYIIKHDFDQDIPYYVRLKDHKNFDEVYNPKFATWFDTKKGAKTWIDTYSSMSDVSKIVESGDAIAAFEHWVISGTVRRTLECINTTKSKPYNNESLEEVINWWIYHRHNDSKIKFKHYTTWPKLYSLSKHLWEVCAYWNRAYTELYISFQIYTNKDGEFDEFKKSVDLVLNKVTYKDDEGYCILPVFDHFLSAHGNSVSLLIHPETKEVKISPQYNSDISYNSLEDAFNYLKKERFYDYKFYR